MSEYARSPRYLRHKTHTILFGIESARKKLTDKPAAFCGINFDRGIPIWNTSVNLVVLCGRLLAGGIVILFAVFYLAEGGVDFSRLTRGERQMMLAVAMCLLGFVIQVIPPYSVSHHAVAGAVLGLLGICAFYWINYSHSGRIPGGPVFPLMFLPGMMEISGKLIRGLQKEASETSENISETPKVS